MQKVVEPLRGAGLTLRTLGCAAQGAQRRVRAAGNGLAPAQLLRQLMEGSRSDTTRAALRTVLCRFKGNFTASK